MKAYINIATVLAALLLWSQAVFGQTERQETTPRTRTQRSAPVSPTSGRPPITDTVTRLPDLMIAGFKNCKDGQVPQNTMDGCFKFLIKNQGSADAQASTLAVSFKITYMFTGAKKNISVLVPALPHGRDAWVTVADNGLQCQQCTLAFIAVLDPEGQIKESDKENNRLAKMLSMMAGPELKGLKSHTGAPDTSHMLWERYQWVPPESETYETTNWFLHRVQAGLHADGTMMYVCSMDMNNGSHPGKLYHDKCYVPWNGKEYVIEKNNGQPYVQSYGILMTDLQYWWVPIAQLSASNIKNWAVPGGYIKDGNSNETLYICRMKLSDGLHAGKFLPSTGTCYVAWNGKELTSTSGFEVLKGE